MHKKALEYAKKVLEEFCLIDDPTCEQASLFESLMCGAKSFVETEYKATIIDEMKEAKEEEKLMEKIGSDRSGYNNNRYASRNRRMGYRPEMYEMEDGMMKDYTENPMEFRKAMMGYNQQENGSHYGRAFDNYREARRHYTETHNEHEKMKMHDYEKENFANIKHMLTDMWDGLEASDKQKYKAELTQMLQQLPS